jgi:hypothetical protein
MGLLVSLLLCSLVKSFKMAALVVNGMKNSLIKSFLSVESSHRLINVRCSTGLRHSKRRGKQPGIARSFEQRIRGVVLF